MRFPKAADSRALIEKLQARANRHRILARLLPSSDDARILLNEADQAEAEAGRLHAELRGHLIFGVGATPLNEQI